MFLKSLALIAAGAMALGCVREIPAGKARLQDRLGQAAAGAENKTTLTYISRFDSKEEARQHGAEMEASGATVRALDNEGRILVITAPQSAVAAALVPVTAGISENGPINLRRPQNAPAALNELESANDAQAFLTARQVTGVTQLAARIPEADGRNVKVAVFDTGIDFGLEGVDLQWDGSRKLTGFYDLSGFGKVTPTAATLRGNQVVIGSRTLTIADEIGATEITAAGILSEKELATEYMTAGGVDLNGNENYDDEFAYVVGRNRDGKLAVWIDANNNLKIDSRAAEELTDYNSTFRSVPLTVTHPNGARPLAVTISSENGVAKVQFHSVLDGHGSSCGIIIAGDGYADGQLQGMAPKAQLVSYMLDATGQDVYTIDEFLAMFLHARDQNVDAISISWGFATADLNSARFVADFLDKEIAAKGIIVGIAAGNEGPGISSGLNDDYVPHHGFAVGAYISEDQARNVYGWTGSLRNDVIWYSSVGPSRGGRQVPDVVSPLMTLVRGERAVSGQQFYGFGGTSSATPALIGSVSALMSAIKAVHAGPVDARLLKLAVTNSASPLAGVDAVRTGAGLIDVVKAYDTYLRLFSELQAAKADTLKRTKFAYDVRAATALENLPQSGEGIHLRSFKPFATVRLALTADSLSLVDPLVFYEAVRLERDGDFFEIQDVIGLQAVPVAFDVRFKSEKLAVPGTYTGSIKVVRTFDNSVLTSIPVVIEIPGIPAANGRIAALNKDFQALDVWRHPVKLEKASAIEIRGIAMDDGMGHNGDLRFVVVAADANVVSYNRIQITTAANVIDLTTSILPAGFYELLAYRSFRQPAVLTGLSVTAAVTLPAADVLSTGFNGQSVQVALSARQALSVKTASLVLDKVDTEDQLILADGNPAFSRQFKAYYGESNLTAATDAIGVRLVQSDFNRAVNPMSHVELVAVDKSTSEILHRGWTNFGHRYGPAEDVEFPGSASDIVWAGWSNIVDWNRPGLEQSIGIIVTTALADKVEAVAKVEAAISAGQSFGVSFDIPEAQRIQLQPGVTGKLKLIDGAGSVLETLDVRL